LKLGDRELNLAMDDWPDVAVPVLVVTIGGKEAGHE